MNNINVIMLFALCVSVCVCQPKPGKYHTSNITVDLIIGARECSLAVDSQSYRYSAARPFLPTWTESFMEIGCPRHDEHRSVSGLRNG